MLAVLAIPVAQVAQAVLAVSAIIAVGVMPDKPDVLVGPAILATFAVPALWHSAHSAYIL